MMSGSDRPWRYTRYPKPTPTRPPKGDHTMSETETTTTTTPLPAEPETDDDTSQGDDQDDE